VTIQSTPVHGVGTAGENYQVWIPLVDGTARLGVLCLTVADVSQDMLDRYRALASLAGLIIEAKVGYSDTYAQTQRSQEMALQAELARPPLGLGDIYACRGKWPHDDAVSVPLCAERLEPRTAFCPTRTE
jgi:hypothetical protein